MVYMILFAMVAAAVLTPTMIGWMQTNNDLMIGTVAARQLHAITQAAKGYVTTYAGALEATATATTPATITIPMLISTGFLPAGFGSTNPYQQTWEVQVLQPTAGSLQALVLSVGGQPIPDDMAPRIGAQAGSSGGTVTAANTAQGSFGSWQVSMAGYSNSGVGHLAALVDYSQGQLQNDFLYRTAVPGNPQLNTMQTNLNMGANNVTNANNVQANSAILAGGNPGGMNGSLQIGNNFLYGDTTNMAVRTPGGFYIQNQNGSANASINGVQNILASGQVNAGYDAVLGTAGGAANAGWGCSPNGSIATNANGSGQLMVCQGGVWGQPQSTPSSTLNTGIAGSYSDPGVYTSNTWQGRLGLCINQTTTYNFKGYPNPDAANVAYEPIAWTSAGYPPITGWWAGNFNYGYFVASLWCNAGVIWAQ